MDSVTSNIEGTNSGVVEEKIPISAIKQRIMLTNDENLARRLQDAEYEAKHSRNKECRQMARVDAPLARKEQTTEEQRVQSERYRELQQLQRITDEDKLLALKIQEDYKKPATATNSAEDIRLSQWLQAQDANEIERQKRELERLEAKDKEFAMELLAKEANTVHDTASAVNRRNSDEANSYRLAPMSDVTDRERQRLRALEDEKYARALQENENKNAKSCGFSSSSNNSRSSGAGNSSYSCSYSSSYKSTSSSSGSGSGGGSGRGRRVIHVDEEAVAEIMMTHRK